MITSPSSFSLMCSFCHEAVIEPKVKNGRLCCLNCWFTLQCQATGCKAVGHYRDGLGMYWCEDHEQQAIFMTLGYEIRFPDLSIRTGKNRVYELPGGQALWFLFARRRKQRGVLQAAIAAALRKKVEVPPRIARTRNLMNTSIDGEVSQ